MLALHRRTGYLFLAILIGHVLLISAQVQSKTGVPMLQVVAFAAFAKVQQVLAATADGGRAFWSNYFALRGVAREGIALGDEILAAYDRTSADIEKRRAQLRLLDPRARRALASAVGRQAHPRRAGHRRVTPRRDH
jgi:hypothetical protein